MEPFEDDNFVAALESLRPTPHPAFAAELDERAATGFPRRSRPAGSALRGLIDRIGAINPRRVLIPAGATALAAVAAVTVVIAMSEDGNGGSPSAGGEALSLVEGGTPRQEANRPHEATAPSRPEHEVEMPSSAESEVAVPSGGASSASATAKVPPSDTGPYASEAPHREIERSAEMVLGTDPTGVRKAASEVFATVHAYRGIVLNSSIRDGAEGEAGAQFELLIPSARLSDALAGFSAIAEVRSRHEATADITAPTVRASERLRDSRAKIESLLAQLSSADTEAERTAVEVQLRSERRHAAYLRSQMSTLERRANLSRVSLRIETGALSSSNETGGWSIGDALDDAGHILTIATGVTIIGLAIIGPLALIALLAWLAIRARIRRSRQRALA